MMLPVAVIRPEPGCSATVRAGREAGLEMLACPLSEIRPVAWQPPSPDSVDALLLGSANAIRHGGKALEKFRDKPVYAVGQATAEAARQAGFSIAGVGGGHLQILIDTQDGLPSRLLRISGAEYVPLKIPDGIEVKQCIAYENAPLPLPDEMAQRIGKGAVVLLYSAASARHFAAECDRLGILRGGMLLAALGPRIADAAGSGWGKLQSAPQPNEAALLALASDLCHEPGHI
ncbi:uroporphyrinogen-III synthase [Altererythrobacter atlanticus]|uniref:Uroporphyrinogen-III synthase n=1 Tax=Croceibacterium atlanticum TaxID=1267766 RepID=A0A0F7KX52_9SPHN|nr:uroporphyrinogen-III synthase [Croceibacterium atlanticum]AKH44254.1 uroporphyrinogen-III synthase [Croceibacterium atlanticum]MBB5732565.1 uroporphyrinogen-III synthase [Croceibacterium atlanticum]